MIAGEDKTKVEQISHEDIEDAVMSALPTLDTSQLEGLYELIGLDLVADNKGKKRVLLKVLRKHLDEIDDEKAAEWQQFQQIYDHLTTKQGKQKVGSAVSGAGSTVSGAGTSTNKNAGENKLNPSNSKEGESVSAQGGSGNVDLSNGMVRIRGIRDYKFPGTIGGESALSYVSIQYQVDSARELNYSDKEIRAGVIRAISPSHELRNYFEINPEVTLDDMLDMFRSTFKERNADTVYTNFQKEFQKKGEPACRFITRLFTLRRKVSTLFEEEGNPINSGALMKRFFHVMFTGLRDTNLRTELRERCRGKTTWLDREIINMVTEIVAVEAERIGKLGEDEPSNEVVEVDLVEKKVPQKKERPNPFTMIEEMNVRHQKEMAAMRNDVTVQLAQIQKAISGSNLNSNAANFHPANQNQPNHVSQGQPAFPQNPYLAPPQNPNFAQPQNQNMGPPPNPHFQQTPSAPPLNPHFQQQQQQQQQQQFRPNQGSKKKVFKCQKCKDENAPRCFHCFVCGATDHKINECPLKV